MEKVEKLTSRERFLNSLLGGPLDRFFRHEWGAWPSTVEGWMKQGLKKDIHEYYEFQNYFEMDPRVRIAVNSGYIHPAYYPEIEKTTLSQTDKHEIYLDKDGITKKVLKEHMDTSMPQFFVVTHSPSVR